MNKKTLVQSLITVAFLLVILGVAPLTFAANNWTPPYGLRPPENNVFAPINIGRDLQVKSGALQVEALRVQLLTFMGWENKTAPTSFPSGADPSLVVEKDVIAKRFCNVNWQSLTLNCLDFDQLSRQGKIIPNGAVMAFNLANCPTESGWYPLDGTGGTKIYGTSDALNLSGRNIIGVGKSNARGSVTHPFGQVSGEEQHQLVIAEMPSHSHSEGIAKTENTRAQNGSDGKTLYGPGSGKTSASGGNGLHNVMDPYVVLTYCVKQ